ncbi:CD82 antigen [Oxyura jamaicensis]|uniref:CD82 antigen n=1 Tax=Oxyura jamaicensis TaxID=8884 RepID=UPI0015A57890|nr:CD82 antigen [Oxyura jamaicensis]XP_035184035.1 CD82 antigen [Oxyura jamaicensis]XP_035184036.1 CD82 antigen [Oxyura jamaicensis]XP_035184037.1 CD82 antigen [Oxyura jamaicensis]
MGSGCLKVTKYFLFLFNLLFLILGAVILGFGIWILADKTSFIAVLQTSSPSLKSGAYILIGVGALTMLMGFLGCLGAVNEIRCLLALYFTCLMVILITQVAAGLVIYFQKEMLKDELSKIVEQLIVDYDPSNGDKNLQDAWDYVQNQISCCGWNGAKDWENNKILKNESMLLYPCSCSAEDAKPENTGFCNLDGQLNSTAPYVWPVHEQGCMDGVQKWLKDNLGIILGVCTGVAVIELLGMILSISLCKNIHSEDYTKVPKS